MNKALKGSAAIALFFGLADAAQAAEYYIYRAADDRVILTNKKPPVSAKTVVTYHLIDTADEEIAATENANQETGRLNALRDLNESTNRLTDAVNNAARTHPPTIFEWNQTAVSVGRQIHRGHR